MMIPFAAHNSAHENEKGTGVVKLSAMAAQSAYYRGHFMSLRQ